MYDFHNLVYSDFSLRSTTRPRFALDDIVGALIPSRDEKREVVKTASRFFVWVCYEILLTDSLGISKINLFLCIGLKINLLSLQKIVKEYMIYIITYNIKTSVRDYTPFYEAIKSECMSYYHAQESTWFVACNERQNVKAMTDFLVKTLYPGDTIFIAELTDRTMVDGWITKDFWNWYRDNIR